VEGAGRESMEGCQIKKIRKGEYRKGKGQVENQWKVGR